MTTYPGGGGHMPLVKKSRKLSIMFKVDFRHPVKRQNFRDKKTWNPHPIPCPSSFTNSSINFLKVYIIYHTPLNSIFDKPTSFSNPASGDLLCWECSTVGISPEKSTKKKLKKYLQGNQPNRKIKKYLQRNQPNKKLKKYLHRNQPNKNIKKYLQRNQRN